MKSTSAEDRVARNRIMDRFCAPRNMYYEPVNDWEPIDAKLYHNDKLIGFAKVKSCASNYGTNPIVGVDRQQADFLSELGKLCGVSVAVVMKFRDKQKYVKLKDIDKLSTGETKRGKVTKTERLLPIQAFQDL